MFLLRQCHYSLTHIRLSEYFAPRNLAEAVTVLKCIRKGPGSNLGMDARSPDSGVSRIVGIVRKLFHGRFLSNPSQFVINQSFCNSTLSGLTYL